MALAIIHEAFGPSLSGVTRRGQDRQSKGRCGLACGCRTARGWSLGLQRSDRTAWLSVAGGLTHSPRIRGRRARRCHQGRWWLQRSRGRRLASSSCESIDDAPIFGEDVGLAGEPPGLVVVSGRLHRDTWRDWVAAGLIAETSPRLPKLQPHPLAVPSQTAHPLAGLKSVNRLSKVHKTPTIQSNASVAPVAPALPRYASCPRERQASRSRPARLA